MKSFKTFMATLAALLVLVSACVAHASMVSIQTDPELAKMIEGCALIKATWSLQPLPRMAVYRNIPSGRLVMVPTGQKNVFVVIYADKPMQPGFVCRLEMMESADLDFAMVIQEGGSTRRMLTVVVRGGAIDAIYRSTASGMNTDCMVAHLTVSGQPCFMKSSMEAQMIAMLAAMCFENCF